MRNHREDGSTLIELLVGLFLGVLVMGVLLLVWNTVLTQFNATLSYNQAVRSVMNVTSSMTDSMKQSNQFYIIQSSTQSCSGEPVALQLMVFHVLSNSYDDYVFSGPLQGPFSVQFYDLNAGNGNSIPTGCPTTPGQTLANGIEMNLDAFGITGTAYTANPDPTTAYTHAIFTFAKQFRTGISGGVQNYTLTEGFQALQALQ